MNNNEKVKFFADMEAFAQKVAQSEDSGVQMKLPLEDHQVININNYVSERKKIHYQVITTVFFLRKGAFLPN